MPTARSSSVSSTLRPLRVGARRPSSWRGRRLGARAPARSGGWTSWTWLGVLVSVPAGSPAAVPQLPPAALREAHRTACGAQAVDERSGVGEACWWTRCSRRGCGRSRAGPPSRSTTTSLHARQRDRPEVLGDAAEDRDAALVHPDVELALGPVVRGIRAAAERPRGRAGRPGRRRSQRARARAGRLLGEGDLRRRRWRRSPGAGQRGGLGRRGRGDRLRVPLRRCAAAPTTWGAVDGGVPVSRSTDVADDDGDVVGRAGAQGELDEPVGGRPGGLARRRGPPRWCRARRSRTARRSRGGSGRRAGPRAPRGRARRRRCR